MSQLCINVAKERLHCINSRVTERFVAANRFLHKILARVCPHEVVLRTNFVDIYTHIILEAGWVVSPVGRKGRSNKCGV